MAKKQGGECASTMNVQQAQKINKSSASSKPKAAPKVGKAPKFMGGKKRGR